MDNLLGVKKLHPAGNLPGPLDDLRRKNLSAFLDHLVQRSLSTILHHNAVVGGPGGHTPGGGAERARGVSEGDVCKCCKTILIEMQKETSGTHLEGHAQHLILTPFPLLFLLHGIRWQWPCP